MIKKERLDSFGRCCICGRMIPGNSLVLRHDETGRIICLICITDIAEIKE